MNDGSFPAVKFHISIEIQGRGKTGMEEKNITMADLITKVIKENQLAPAEEDAVLAMLGERKQ